MYNLILLSLIVPVVGFFFECYPRFFNRKVGVDIWTHLLYLKEYHRQKGIPKIIDKGFLVSGQYDYPPAFITILSQFPMRIVEKYEFLFSPFFDAIHILIIFFLSYYLTGSIPIALSTQVLYVITPIIVIENSSATPRSLGYLLFTITLFSSFFFQQTGALYFAAFAVTCGTLIFLAHRFTTQGFLFFSIFFSIVERDLMFVFVFLASFSLAIIVSKGFYLKVLQGHLGNLAFWKENIEYRFAHQIRGNREDKKTSDFVFRVYNQFLRFPPFVLAITNPWTLSAFYYAVIYFPREALYQKLILWVVFSYILALMTIWIKPLRFLGEGQRYLELSAFPAAFLSALLLFRELEGVQQSVGVVAFVLVAIACIGTIVVIQRKAIINDKLRTLTDDLVLMFRYLRSLNNKPRLLCIPHQITTNTIYHTGCSVFVNADYKNINKISDVYPYLRIPVDRVIKKYGLDGVLLNEAYASVIELNSKELKITKRFGNYVLLNPK